MNITIKEKITKALEDNRDAMEPIALFRALALENKDEFAGAVQELEREGVLVTTKKGRLMSAKSAGFLSALRHPFTCQPLAHPFVMASETYLESVVMVTWQGSFKQERASITPVSSMRLLVVLASAPESTFSLSL